MPHDGLLHKYEVHHVSDPHGKHDDCRYFVLDPGHDLIAWIALAAYAEHPSCPAALRSDLINWLDALAP